MNMDNKLDITNQVELAKADGSRSMTFVCFVLFVVKQCEGKA